RHKTQEPRWPAAIALLAVGCLWLALPQRLSIGPRWLLLALVLTLLLPIVFTHRRGHHTLNRILTLLANSVITLSMISSLIFLVDIRDRRFPPQIRPCYPAGRDSA